MNRVLLDCNKFTALRNSEQVFKPLTFIVKAGECHQLLGNNGSGKTTCLQAILGLKSYTGKLSNVECSYLGHNNGLYQTLTVEEIINWWLVLADNGKRSELALGLPASAIVGALSNGQKRLLAWSRLQIESCRLWLLDEPLTNIDKNQQEVLLKLAHKHMASGGAIIVATHMQPLWLQLISHTQEIKALDE